ncbi:MAG TPA: protein kinase [Acidimicrobiales bacterium]|nr:protein kinase [Acidimicrobiales bacterium]
MTPSRTDLLLAGRYRLGSLLGTGGMAEVYDAVDERLDRPVAVKLLRPEMAARDDVRVRFEAEARSAARLVHPNVVGVFDSGEDDDGALPYLIMERLPGESLADRMEAAGDEPLDHEWVLRVGGDVLMALGAAHAAGLVHRDVKPANVLLATDGCAKVADFGIAKSLEVAAAADLTSTNQLVGTPAYVAPERILGEPASLRSDLYAVGVLLYEALAGRKPFRGDTPVATAYAIQHQTPTSLAELRPDLAPEVVAAVERAMDRDPARRFASAAEMATALGLTGSALTGLPADATILSAPSPAADETQVLPVGDAVPVASPVGPTTTAPTWPGLLEDRRRLALVAVACLVVALVLFALAAANDGGGDAKGGDGDRAALVSDLRHAGDDLDAEDGDQSGEAAGAVSKLADAVDDGGGAPEATALLAQLSAWRDTAGLTAAAADGLATIVRRVPGVDGGAYAPPTTAAPPPPSTTAAPATAPPAPRKARGKGKDD